jgi:transposase-like protein
MEFRREADFAGETEGARRATGVSPAGAAGVPDPAVEAKAKRRRFTAEYKLRILREVERAKESGEIGAILRREGLYSSLLAAWRRDRDRVAKTGLAARKRGPKAKVVDPRVKELEREIAKLRRRNERVELLLSIQKKASELLGIPLNPHDPDEND